MLYADPLRLMHLQVQSGMMAAEAGAVIWMRLLGMSGFWSVPPSENARMVAEKQVAFALAGKAAFRAAMQGKAPDKVLAASLRPVRRKTRANAKRLAKSGPTIRMEM